MVTDVERQLVREAIDQGGSVLIEKRDEPDRALLRMAVRKCQRTRPGELASEGVVAALGSLNHLAAQRLQVVLHPAERRLCGALERGIDGCDGVDEWTHAGFEPVRHR